MSSGRVTPVPVHITSTEDNIIYGWIFKSGCVYLKYIFLDVYIYIKLAVCCGLMYACFLAFHFILFIHTYPTPCARMHVSMSYLHGLLPVIPLSSSANGNPFVLNNGAHYHLTDRK